VMTKADGIYRNDVTVRMHVAELEEVTALVRWYQQHFPGERWSRAAVFRVAVHRLLEDWRKGRLGEKKGPNPGPGPRPRRGR